MTEKNRLAGRVFISYVREDAVHADRLCRILETASIEVWRDIADLWPGEDWRAKVRAAISGNTLVFVACFSQASVSRAKSFQNDELALAVEQLRSHPPGHPWLIPVRFDDCQIPEREIGGGRTLADLHRADLFGEGYSDNAARLVAAIQRILGHGSEPLIGDGNDRQVRDEMPAETGVDNILKAILAADQVDIVGVLPWQCAERLIELKAQKIRAGQSVIRPEDVRYYTPASNRVTVFRESEVLGLIAQRWSAGIYGVRNWLRTGTRKISDAGLAQVLEIDDLYLSCMICIETNEEREVVFVSEFPVSQRRENMAIHDVGALIIARMDDEHMEQVLTHLAALKTQTSLMRPRRILCSLEQSRALPQVAGNEFLPVISHLHPYHSDVPDNTIAASIVVAVCAQTAQGPAILLEERTFRNSIADLGKLSLISGGLMVEDMHDPDAGELAADDEAALEDLWLRAGQPSSFKIPESAFRRSAQRELFVSCGLDMPSDRLELRGTCLLEHEEMNNHVGFYVFRAELQRSPTADEYRHALRWNPDLRVILLKDLYRQPIRARLNRLLRQRDAWLPEAVLGM
jgi:TIR domain-containing protein